VEYQHGKLVFLRKHLVGTLFRLGRYFNITPTFPILSEINMRANPPSPLIHRSNLQGDDKATLICFSHLRWDFVLQRPQHLLTRAAQQFDVLFFEEPGFSENGRAHLSVKKTEEGVTVVTPMLPGGLCESECIMTQRRLLNILIASRKNIPAVAWYYTPMALQFSAHIKFDCTVYDCMDELSNFKFAPANLVELEAELFRIADVVFTGGRALFEAKKHKHGNIHAFPSSIDRAHFLKARSTDFVADPVDQASIPGPRIGYFGVIDERTDLALIRAIAEQRPQFHFVMLGPVVKIDPASLPQGPNLHWLGQKHYADLPRYMAHWNAGFMPFAINDATRFISPTKTPEFLAAGLPVVSTPVEDVVRSWGRPGLVGIASTSAQMCAEIDRALVVDKSLWLRRVDQVLSSMSWDQTFASMLSLINRRLPQAKMPALSVASAVSSRSDAHV
jgi:glycosyltransferase involved in cell wall biosynthesis